MMIEVRGEQGACAKLEARRGMCSTGLLAVPGAGEPFSYLRTVALCWDVPPTNLPGLPRHLQASAYLSPSRRTFPDEQPV